MKVLIKAFLDYLEAEKNASIHTRLAYERDLREFTRFLEDSRALSSGGVVTGVKESDITAFAANLHGTRKKATIARKVSSIKSFFALLLRKEIITKNPSALVTRPKVEKRLPTVLTVEEAKSLVEAPQGNWGKKINAGEILRDRAILEVLYSSGVRVSALRNAGSAVPFSSAAIRSCPICPYAAASASRGTDGSALCVATASWVARSCRTASSSAPASAGMTIGRSAGGAGGAGWLPHASVSTTPSCGASLVRLAPRT